MSELLISVITVVLNDREGLARTLASYRALISKDEKFELIVIDGASVDGTYEVIRANLDLISCHLSEKDGGIYDAMNKGIIKSKGKFIWFVNAGDKILSKPILGVERQRSLNLAVHTFPVLLAANNNIYYGNITHPHQGIIYGRSVFKSLGNFEDYKLISDRVFYDQIIKFNVPIFRYSDVICEFSEGGLSSNIDSYRVNYMEFKKNFLIKKDFRSCYRLINSFCFYLLSLIKRVS